MKLGKSIINIGQNKQAAATHHFNDIQLDLKEKGGIEELTHGENENEFKQIFKTQTLILSTFIENIVFQNTLTISLKAHMVYLVMNIMLSCFVQVKSYCINIA